jgi:hypothetical protein
MAFKLNRSSKEPMSEINVHSVCRCNVSIINYLYGNSTFTNGWSTSRPA